MKKRRWICAALLVCAILLSSCSGGAVKLKFDNGAFRNDREGMAFHYAPICYRAASAKKKDGAVAILQSGSDDVMLYAIEDMDAQKWLTDENFMLYYGEGETLPTLAQLKPTLITNSQAGFGITVIDDPTEIADLLETYEKGTSVPSQKIIPMKDERYEMVFSSNTYPGILYLLECWRFSEEVIVYSTLDENGQIPTDLYPGIRAEIVNGTAAFYLGKTLLYDRHADVCYPLGSAYDAYFPLS